MRYLISTLLSFLFLCAFLNAQDCPQGDVIITCQDEFDAFEAQYPNCTQINGNLILKDDEYTCWTLDPNFPALERITGHLRVWTWMSADAFPNLRYIGGGIDTDDEFSGTFAVLDTVMGTVSMDNSYQGVSFPTCPQLKYVGGNLGIYTDEGGIFDSHDFPALEYIGGNLYDYSNWTDSDFSGFTNLRYIGGDVNIEEGEIEGWNALDTIGGDLILRRYEFDWVSVKVNITGMNQLQYIGGNFKLSNIDADGNQQCVEDLSGLSQLNYIGGDFEYIWQYEWDGSYGCSNPLTTLSSLQQLKQVGGNVTIDGNDLLNLDFLIPLESIGGNLEITGNDLQNIEGLNHSIAIGGELIIENNSDLSECAVQAVCEHLENNGGTTISDNLAGCDNVQEVLDACGVVQECALGDVVITSQAEMDNFAATYPNCTQINGNFITDNDDPDVTINISSLPELQHITGTISIGTHTVLSANSFVALTHVDGSVHLSADIDGDFPVLENIGGSIVVFDGLNTGAHATGGYPALKYIGGGISAGGAEGGFLNSNDFPLLERIEGGISGCGWGPTHDFSGFDNLRYIGGSIVTQQGTISGMNMVDTIRGGIIFNDCYNNSMTIQITGLNQLKHIGGNLRFNDQHCLQDLSGLTQVETIDGSLSIMWQYNFACSTSTDNLTGLGQLQHIGGNLKLVDCNLSNLDFLGQLVSVGDSLHIRYNGFDNIEGLNHAVDIGGELIIANNPNLSECAVQAVCEHLNSNEPATITNNMSGCDNIWEVQAACDPMLCPPGDITLTTQEEVDALFAVYSNCTELLGKLIIRADDPADISNLNALSELTSTGGGLLIDNTAIANLNGLQNLTTTGYNLAITNNLNLTSLVGLENITSTASHLKIENNDDLTDLSGLNNITQVGESLLIFDNDNLQNLSGLNALTSIGSQLYLKSNINMTSLSGLENLTSIGADIRIQSNPSLGSLSALSNVTTISGYIRITDNDALISLTGLDNINPNGITEIRVTNNANLSMCSASSICGHIEDDGMTTFSTNAAGCNSLSEVTDICVVSTHTPEDAPDIAISPNPSDGTFTIEGITNARYDIHSLTGQIIQSGELKNDTSIDILSEAQGVYFISISIGNEIITKRIIKM